jgi:hypothetical protein
MGRSHQVGWRKSGNINITNFVPECVSALKMVSIPHIKFLDGYVPAGAIYATHEGDSLIQLSLTN